MRTWSLMKKPEVTNSCSANAALVSSEREQGQPRAVCRIFVLQQWCAAPPSTGTRYTHRRSVVLCSNSYTPWRTKGCRNGPCKHRNNITLATTREAQTMAKSLQKSILCSQHHMLFWCVRWSRPREMPLKSMECEVRDQTIKQHFNIQMYLKFNVNTYTTILCGQLRFNPHLAMTNTSGLNRKANPTRLLDNAPHCTWKQPSALAEFNSHSETEERLIEC